MNNSLINTCYSQCFEPKKVEIFDPIERKKVLREVPCGYCYHCKITKVNEWLTRMLLQYNLSKYSYYVTLTYDSCTCTDILLETYPVKNKLNKFHKYMTYPLCLCKSHLQKFLKRLRKNTGVKFQYFAAGEYGYEWNRPHYHLVFWSDEPLSKDDVQFAWSVLDGDIRYKIGNIDFQDMKVECINLEYNYKYMCKYLQKDEENFKSYKSYKYHRENCEKNFSPNGFSEESWYQYTKRFRSFTCCSKKPAIGFQYFKDNETRFQKGDFRIFELSDKCVFPTYFFRKTKESICPYKTISVENNKPNTYSAIPDVVSLLVDIKNAISYNQDVRKNLQLSRSVRFDNGFISGRTSNGDNFCLSSVFFEFYDCKNKFHYKLNDKFSYDVSTGRGDYLYTVSIDSLINDLSSTYNNLMNELLIPLRVANDVKRKDIEDSLISEFGSMEKYDNAKKLCIRNLQNTINERQAMYKQSKVLF